MENPLYKNGMDLMGEIYNNFSEVDKAWFHNTDPIEMHHTLGRHLRNHCGMWLVEWTPVVVDGVDHSPEHPDAISQQVIVDFQKKVNKNV